jgi:hypothetical protein
MNKHKESIKSFRLVIKMKQTKNQSKEDLREGRELITNILKNNQITSYKIGERWGMWTVYFTFEENQG